VPTHRLGPYRELLTELFELFSGVSESYWAPTLDVWLQEFDEPGGATAHGTGSWAPQRVCAAFPQLLVFFARWLKLWRAHHGCVRDVDGCLQVEVRAEIETVAAAHLDDADSGRL